MTFNWARRWFRQLRAIETECDQLRETVASLQNEKLRLEDRLVAAQQDRDRLWESFQQSLQGERTAYQLHINMSLQRMGGGVPYPDAPHLPQHAVPEASNEPLGRRGRVLMSEVLAQRTDEVMRSKFAKAER
jgi:hypothetical protein